MAFKDLFIKEDSAPPKQPVVAQEVAPNAESIMPSQPVVGKAPVDKEIEAKIWDMIVAKNLLPLMYI